MKARSLNYSFLLKLMPVLILIVCLMMWQMFLKKTWESYSNFSLLNSESGMEALGISPAYTRQRVQDADKLYNRFLIDTISWKNRLWDRCAMFAQRLDCTVIGFPPKKNLKFEQADYLEQQIIFKGNYHQLIRLQNAVDTLKNIGVIGSLTYVHHTRDSLTTLSLQMIGIHQTLN